MVSAKYLVTISQVVTKFNVTKSRLHCIHSYKMVNLKKNLKCHFFKISNMNSKKI